MSTLTIQLPMNRWPVILAGLGLCLVAGHSSPTQGGGSGPRQPAGDYVILLHGLGRSAWSMKRLEWALTKEGYRVINVSYPSTRYSIQDLARDYLAKLLQAQTPDRQVKIHFVTHSLGGIIVRQYLSEHALENLGRVVMLAPPNQGSELTDKLRRNFFYKLFMGPSGQQLGTDADSVPKRLGPARFELGVIAGDRSLNPLFSAWIPGPDDGKVSVESTTMPAMKDFLVVHHTHTWMMWSKEVVGAVLQFLRNGKFK